MPYQHSGCGGEVHFWRRRCQKCGHRWPFSAIFAGRPPGDMRYVVTIANQPQVVGQNTLRKSLKGNGGVEIRNRYLRWSLTFLLGFAPFYIIFYFLYRWGVVGLWWAVAACTLITVWPFISRTKPVKKLGLKMNARMGKGVVGKTPYLPWMDNVPNVWGIRWVLVYSASHLPSWPRWLRVISLLGVTAVLSFIFYWFIGR